MLDAEVQLGQEMAASGCHDSPAMDALRGSSPLALFFLVWRTSPLLEVAKGEENS